MIETTKNGKTILRAKVKSSNGHFSLWLKADKAIERFFSLTAESELNTPQSEGISSQWSLTKNGKSYRAKFYPQIKDAEWSNFLRRYELQDNYGAGFEQGRNISLLRTQGISQGITLLFQSRISLTEVEEGIKHFGENVKTFYTEFLRPIEVEMTVKMKK